MAAEALLSVFLQGVFEKLSSSVLKEFGLLWAFNDELDKLRSTATTIQAVLVDAERRQRKDESVKIWVGKIKDVAYDMEDIFDDLETEALRRKVEAREETMFHGRIVNNVRDFFSPSNQLVLRRKMGHKIKKIQERLDAIAAERVKFHFREGVELMQTASIFRRHTSTHSRVTESEVYGRDSDKAKIVELLLLDTGNAKEDVSVVSIIGMGGLGKTTLAKLVFNEERVKQHFDLRMWVDVSLDFDVKRLTKKILEAATNKKCDLLSMDLLQSRLEEALNGKRFLLVLDDVWNEDPNKWNNLKTLLRGSVGGCKILATTRHEKVALIMGTRPMHHHLLFLSGENCWSLFRQRAFEPGQEEEYPNLVSIGKQIVEKCGGLPLAAEAIGGLMFSKKEEREWLSVRDSEVWNLDEDGREILPALKLSYDNLPSRLKQCFAYCSIFPKAHELEKDTLIKLWMAQGFLQSSSSMRSKTMEEIGNDYFTDLVQRSLFQQDEDYKGDIVFKMHDRIHDLAASVAGAEYSDLKNSLATSTPEILRHSSLFGDNVSGNLQPLKKANKLRTFFLPPSSWRYQQINLNICWDFRQLRVLDLLATGIVKLPASIGNLKKLRYLDLSWTRITSFPKTFCNLHNLQTLKLFGCDLKELPRDMRKMISLRHVEFNTWRSFPNIPERIGELSCLQTLPVFIVGKEIGHRIEELKRLKLLQGHLEIRELQNVRSSNEAHEANLKEKRNLRSLTLSWEDPDGGDDANSTREKNDEIVIEGLQPFSALKELVIKNYMGGRLPSWLMDSSSLRNLVEIRLTGCRRCECLPQLVQFPFLKVLTIDGLKAIKFINMAGCESSQGLGIDAIMGFPSLEEFSLVNMPDLEGWSTSAMEEGQERQQLLFPRLRELTIESCPKLVSFPRLPLPSLEELRLKNMPELEGWSTSAMEEGQEREQLLFPRLRELTIKSCPKLVSFPRLPLPSLEELRLKNMPELEGWSTSGVEEGQEREQLLFPRLRQLMIESCPKLVSFPRLPPTLEHLDLSRSNEMLLRSLVVMSSSASLSISYFPEMTSLAEGLLPNHCLLQSLKITYCPKLKSLSKELQNQTALEKLDIRGCTELALLRSDFKSLTSLKRLSISTFGGIDDEPLPSLASLEKLGIYEHHLNLRSLPMGLRYITSLTQLKISNCPEMTSLPEGMQHLTALSSLDISSCSKLSALLEEGMQSLNALQYLSISDCPELSCLPEGMKHLTALRDLNIYACPKLAILPETVGNLTSLRDLTIINCPGMTSLPASLQQLTQLEELYISKCPKLKRRYNKRSGKDWKKIEHIPNIVIKGDEEESRSTRSLIVDLLHRIKLIK